MLLNYLKKFSNWITLAVATTFIFAFIFIAVHHIIRTDANTPLVSTAQNIISYIETDQNIVEQIKESTKIDLANSDKTFVIIYDKDNNLLASTAVLNGTTPELPKGVTENAKKIGVNKVTWAPKNNARQAIVVYPINNGDGGYLLVGQSLKYTEESLNKISKILFLGWAITILSSFLTKIILSSLIETLIRRDSRRSTEADSNESKAEIKKAEVVKNTKDQLILKEKLAQTEEAKPASESVQLQEEKAEIVEKSKKPAKSTASKKSKKPASESVK